MWMGYGDLYSGLFSHTKSNIPEYGQGIFPDIPGHIPESTANFIFASMDHLSPFVD